MKARRGERGFGLVELMISLAITGTILSALGMTLVAVIKDSAGGFTASLSGASVTYTLTVQNGPGTQSRTETTLMRVSDTPTTPFPTVTYTPTPTNTPTPTPGAWFQTGSYVGDGVAGRTISGLSFQPDIVIVRSNAG